MISGWSELIGNRHVVDWFGNAIQRKRLGGSFLLVGPAAVGKRSVASLLAKTLLCDRNPPSEMAPCGTCEACVQVSAETHPDVLRVRKPTDKTTIPIDLLIGRPEARMQEGFCRDVRLSPFCGKQKVAMIEDADFLNEEGANCLLKTLEEPPPDAVILLIGTSEQKQLPTIRSRCQVIRFSPLREQDAVRLLHERHQLDADETLISAAVRDADGDIPSALRMLGEETRQFRSELISKLSTEHPDPIAIRRLLQSRLDQAGKESPVKRDALRDVFSIAIQHYRKQLRDETKSHSVLPETLNRLDRSVRAVRELDRMANLSTLVDCYAADISQGLTGDRGGINS